MAFREPFRTPLGAFQRTPLQARRRGAAPPPRPALQEWEGRNIAIQSGLNHADIPECGVDEPRPLWDLTGSQPTQGLWYQSCPFATRPASIAAWQWDRNDAVNQFEGYYTIPNFPMVPWDAWVGPAPDCWSRATPASNEPGQENAEFAATIAYFSASPVNPPDYLHLYTYDALEPVGFERVRSPVWQNDLWLCRAVPSPATITPIPLIETQLLPDSSQRDYVNLRANADCLCPFFRMENDGGIPGSIIMERIRPTLLDAYRLELTVNGFTATPGDYSVTVSAQNAWNSVPSQTTFTWRLLPR